MFLQVEGGSKFWWMLRLVSPYQERQVCRNFSREIEEGRSFSACSWPELGCSGGYGA